jgi:hypothetical protein
LAHEPATIQTASQAASQTADDAWRRTGPDLLTRGPYRISKSFVARRHIGASPVYHCFHLHAFIGACPSPDDAKALCDQHEVANPIAAHPHP